MVLSINYFKIAKNFLRKRRRVLTKKEKKDFIQKMAGINILLNILLCISLGFVGAAGIFFLFFKVIIQIN